MMNNLESIRGIIPNKAMTTGSGDRRSPDPVDAPTVKETEVLERPLRRKYKAEYKLKILKEADTCTESGQMGALLRREGLYSSNITLWRKQLDQGIFEGLSPAKRGPKKRARDERDQQIQELQKQNERLKKKMKQAEIIIEFQKKASEILGIPLGED